VGERARGRLAAEARGEAGRLPNVLEELEDAKAMGEEAVVERCEDAKCLATLRCCRDLCRVLHQAQNKRVQTGSSF